MATKRLKVVEAIATLIRNIDGSDDYNSNLYENVYTDQKYWDELEEFPSVTVIAGNESREYVGGVQWAYLTILITIYVRNEKPQREIESIFKDIEILLDANNTLTIDSQSVCTDLLLRTLADDGGILSPQGVGEMTYNVQYNI